MPLGQGQVELRDGSGAAGNPNLYTHYYIMSTKSTTSLDGRALLTLAFGFTFLILSNGRFSVPVAAWIVPVFLLYFFRRAPVWQGALLLYVALLVSFIVAFFGWIPVPGVAFIGMASGIVLL